MRYIILLLMLSLPTFSDSASESDHKEILLENDRVQVVRLTYPPATESGMHTHRYPNRTVYVLKGGLLELSSSGSAKPAKTLQIKEGMTLFAQAETHNVKNVGSTEIVLLETELK
ncbi:hypothetical protein L4174_020345 [Photobacterium sp. CCB-ST2H9]|uniref:cupin domain-containing protein n=1 Tax=Photobacterium sp. CCB-ST2H9 TaxID=2912855 RepID=UPI00200421FB|nr:cupin domain-containing protein [Photobacterium sp. CCB-ST2H9]UTM59065.1 hypothetical protein L4174_020345 [Photobacterium sp. CCB-ST2H9]